MSTSILNNPLFIELFGISESEQEPSETITAEPMKPEELKDLEPVKENEHDNIFSYRPEVLKNKLSDYLCKLKKAGATYTVSEGYSLADRRIKITCKDSKVQEQLINELHNDTETEALLILKAAIRDADLAYSIKERASIRWADGNLSDSLFLAVLCNLMIINERPSKELQPITEWRDELKQLGII